MTDNPYLPAGIGAIALALLFPIYWVLEIAYAVDTGGPRTDLGALDVLYLVLAGLIAWLYWSFRRNLNEHSAYHATDTLLNLVGVAALVVYPLITILAVTTGVTGSLAFTTAFVGHLILFGVLESAIAILLLRDAEAMPGTVKAFAVATLLSGISQFTVILAFASLILTPVAMVLLAVHFLRKPDLLEIV